MDIMNVLCTGMNMSISRIHIWLCYIFLSLYIYIYKYIVVGDSSIGRKMDLLKRYINQEVSG